MRGKTGPKPCPIAHRFEAKVDRSGGPEACHPWTAGKDKGGYGQVSVSNRRKGLGAHVRGAHVVALELKLGRPLREGLCALHTCDNRACCNPAHLYEGTKKQNTADAKARGRLAKGKRHGSKTRPESVVRGARRVGAKLNEAAVLDIRTRKETLAVYAERYGVSESAVWLAQTGKKWAHVGAVAA